MTAIEYYAELAVRAGIDIDDVGRFERDSRAVAVHHAGMRRLRQIRRRACGELGIVFDRRHPPRGADQLGENCRVIADADMQDMLPWLGAAAAISAA